MADLKYANLPDLDVAPGLYETPELADDISTLPTSTTNRSPSPPADAGPDDQDSAIVRASLSQDQARLRFLPKNEQGDARVHTNSYPSRSRSWRASRPESHQDIINGVIDHQNDERPESVDLRIARLRREILEIQDEVKAKLPESGKQNHATEDPSDELDQLLASIASISDHTIPDAARRLAKDVDRKTVDQQESINQRPQSRGQEAGHGQSGDTQSLVVDFEARLKLLESSLGIDKVPLDSPETTRSMPLLPNLAYLEKQIDALCLSETALDKLKTKVSQLTQEISRLEQKRVAAKRAQDALDLSPTEILRPSTSVAEKVGDQNEDPDHLAKINALYGTLHTIESLAPLLPSVLERLRSLRSLHSNAAVASDTLGRLEAEQASMQAEIASWREGLLKVESAVQEGSSTMKSNTEVVETWVKDLERRLTLHS